jgi:CheY-like chemotaxis protein
VITDIFMPEKEGLETISELRKEFLAVKIIAISGGGYGAHYSGSFGTDVALEAAKEFGADRTLQKPFKLEHLVRIVNEMLHAND